MLRGDRSQEPHWHCLHPQPSKRTQHHCPPAPGTARKALKTVTKGAIFCSHSLPALTGSIRESMFY